MNRADYLDRLVSSPWSREENCWHFVRQLRHDLFGCDVLPLIGCDVVIAPGQRRVIFETHPARSDWAEVFQPQDGDVVIMEKPGTLHAGIYLITDGRGHVWHRDTPHGVVADTLMELTRLRRWTPRFFRHRS